VNALAVDVLGTVVTVAAPAPVLAELRVSLRDLCTSGGTADRHLTLSPTGRGFDLRDDGRVVAQGVDPSVASATVAWRLNAIAGESTAHVLLHAGCVAGARGGAVLLIGASGAGKSTLTAACVAAGLRYHTDELAAVDLVSGRLAPYPKPLRLEGGRLVPGSSLGAVADGTVTPAALVFVRYEPGATLTETTLDGGWALLALVAHATNLWALGGPALAWLAGLALTYRARQLTYGDTGAAVAAVQRAAAGPGRPVVPAQILPPIAAHTTTVAVDDGLAVLQETTGKVHLLNSTAADVWRRASGVSTASTAATDRAMAAATVDRLMSAGLLAGAART
jgi:hypothetical protein